MKNIKIALAAFFGIIIVLWLSATTFLQQWGLIPTRNVLVQLTGSISFLAMTGCLILAVRPKFLERPLGGLDKMYRLHKWLGIVALSGSVLHWIASQLPKWLAKLAPVHNDFTFNVKETYSQKTYPIICSSFLNLVLQDYDL